MDNKHDTQEFDLEDIMNEFLDAPEPETVEADEELKQLQELPPVEVPQVPEAQEEKEETPAETPTEAPEAPAPQLGDTIRMEQIIREVRAETREQEAAVSEDATIRMEVPETPAAPEEKTKALPDLSEDI